MCVALFLALATCTLFAAEKRSRTPRPFPNPFFAMCTGTSDARHPTVASQVAMLRELGYDGIDHMGTRNVAATVREADAAGLKMFGIYVGGIDIDPDDPLPGGLRDAAGRLEGIGGDVEDNLRRSKRAWDKMTARLARDSASYASVEAWLPQVLTDEMTTSISQFNEGDSRAVISTLARRLREAPAHLRPALEKRLITLLEGECTADGKAQVCRLLRDWGSESCIPVLAELIRAPRVGTVALDALQAKPGTKATGHLIDALHQATTESTAVAIMSALGERRDDDAVAPLHAIARAASGQLADAAPAALARIGSKPASEALIRLSESKTKPDACAHALLECAERFRRDGALADAAGLYSRLLSESAKPAFRNARCREQSPCSSISPTTRIPKSVAKPFAPWGG